MGIINLEDMIMPKSPIKEEMDETVEIISNDEWIFNLPEFEGSTLQKSMVELDHEITFEVGKAIAEEIDRKLLPEYLINDPEIVGYPDLEFQEQIYDWVKGSIPTQGYTIKDLGCGRGDFFGHISKRESWEEKFKDIHYFGLELNQNLCTIAKQKYPEINILNNDYFDTDIHTDYTVCIGTLGDNLGQDKWKNFNKTLNWAINNTKIAVIFILQKDCYGNEGFFDYPFKELFENIDPNVKFVLDYSELEDIYKLTVHIGGFNS
jgi:SAM-dependent methyltransferase